MGMVPKDNLTWTQTKRARFGKDALLILASPPLYGRLVFALVFVSERSRRINLFSAPGTAAILTLAKYVCVVAAELLPSVFWIVGKSVSIR
jgi:hypothetical protein